MIPHLSIDQARIADFCQRHHIRKLALFGSVLRADFGPASDVDVLYAFEEGHVPGWAIVDIEEELAGILGRRVDFVSAKYLNPRLAAGIISAAQVIYEKQTRKAG